MNCTTIIANSQNNIKYSYLMEATKENWMALTIAICTHKTCEQSLAAMGIAHEDEPKRIDCPYQNKARVTYVLSKVCGLKVREIKQYLGIGKTTISRAIGFIHNTSINKENAI